MSAHSLLADVIRSPITKTERSEHQMTRAAHSRCDNGVLGVNERMAESATVLSVYSQTYLNWRASPRTKRPTQIDLLGVDLDLDFGLMRLSENKRARYAALCRAVSTRRSEVPLAEFRELLGKLTFASIVYPKGRQWVAPCWRSFKIALKRSRVFRPEHRMVFISKHVRAALQRWATELEDPEHVGVPMACREWVPAYGAPGVGVIYADASGEEGWAAWTFVSGVVYMVSGVWGELDRGLIIADKELVASTAPNTLFSGEER